ncbi:hypothetical protein PCASD_26507 [Puccinia coronata f. sp. avenae]|uniref:Uncharacterized protein n=1 Tax=Puccinia coronata f. sp. avenae TaxID=200324 RepID=A0A2N5TJN6_9BASI|nr:hypothetical protein PCASD_26507 [Puccinia coronata f. sp. avenae]
MLSFFLITRHGQRCRDSSQAQSPQASQWPSTKEHPYAPRFTFQQQVLHNLGDPSMPSGASAGKKALGRFALSSENLGGVSSQHEQPVASSALKALLQHRQRLLSLMSYPAKLKREGVAGVLGVHLGRARRGSLGESSTWHWLKGLIIKPASGSGGRGHGKPPPCVQASSSGSLYTDMLSSLATAARQPAGSLVPPAPIVFASPRRQGHRSPSSTFTKLSSLLASLSSLLAGLSSLLAGSSSLLTGPSRLLGLLGEQVTLLAELVQAVSARPTE